MKKYQFQFTSFCLLLICFSACQNNEQTKNQTSTAAMREVTKPDTLSSEASLDTITSLGDQKDSVAIFKSPDGNFYKVYLTDENGNLVQPQTIQSRPTDTLYCNTDLFLGTKRKNAKSTILVRTFKNYQSVAALNATLATDSVMRHLVPPISSAVNSPRVAQEKKNVTLVTAYIYAVRREDDNDFHIIVGDSLPFNAANAINVEIAGLPNPANSSTDTLQNVRTIVENYFGEKCSGAYSTFLPPIKISVSGSLFYDIDHAPGIVGTGIYKPLTSWEIHPASGFQFK